MKERRKYRRVLDGYKAELIYGRKSYPVLIEDVSKNGACVISDTLMTSVKFAIKETARLKLSYQSRETFNFKCTIQWISKMPSHAASYKIGIQIIDPEWGKRV